MNSIEKNKESNLKFVYYLKKDTHELRKLAINYAERKRFY